MKRKKVEREERARRLSKQDELAARVEREWAHQNSAVIASRQRVLQFEAEETDKSIAALTAAVINLKERRRVIDATLQGLATVVARRC